MYEEVIDQKVVEMTIALEHFQREMGKIRTGRANPSAFEEIMVDYYGSKSPLKQVASITVPEARLILIQAWDADNLSNIEAALRSSDPNINPNNDGKVIRINVPPLTEERRREIVKSLNQKAEEARISVRTLREETWNEIQKMEKNGKITEDDKYVAKERLQEYVDGFNKKIEEMREKKEQEIMTV